MLIQLGIIGILAAMLPLAIVWVSDDPDKYRKLVWVTLFLTFDLIMFGAFTRLTDSGLGCPDWPGCYGHADPMRAHADISAAATQRVRAVKSYAIELTVDGRAAFFIENDNSYGLFVNVFDETGAHIAYGGFDENYDFYWLK